MDYRPPGGRAKSGTGGFTAKENLTLPGLKAFWQGGRLQHRRERGETLRWMRRSSIVPVEPDRTLSTFSGGNQQKMLFSKWVLLKPLILILHQPTPGGGVRAGPVLYLMIPHCSHACPSVPFLSSSWG